MNHKIISSKYCVQIISSKFCVQFIEPQPALHFRSVATRENETKGKGIINSV